MYAQGPGNFGQVKLISIQTYLPLKKNIAPENRKDAQKESSPQITIFQGPKMLGF